MAGKAQTTRRETLAVELASVCRKKGSVCRVRAAGGVGGGLAYGGSRVHGALGKPREASVGFGSTPRRIAPPSCPLYPSERRAITLLACVGSVQPRTADRLVATESCPGRASCGRVFPSRRNDESPPSCGRDSDPGRCPTATRRWRIRCRDDAGAQHETRPLPFSRAVGFFGCRSSAHTDA